MIIIWIFPSTDFIISPKTVDTYLCQVKQKFNVTNKGEFIDASNENQTFYLYLKLGMMLDVHSHVQVHAHTHAH